MSGPELSEGLRVALFSGNYNYLREGANQALNLLAEHVERRGGQVRAYSPVTDTPAFPPKGTLVPIPSVTAPGRPEFRMALRLPKAARDDLRRFAPHIVHLSTPDILGRHALAFARRLGLPVVASVHTRFEDYPVHYGLGFLGPAVRRLVDDFHGHCDLVMVPTPAMAAELSARLGTGKVRIWGRGVDTERFDPARRSEARRAAFGLAPDELALLFFGRLVLEKGIERFAEAVAALRARGHKVRPVLVGAGPARRRAARMLPDAIFTGHLDGDALGTAVASADILIHASVTETFGNVMLEAMASGLAIVALADPSVTHLVEHGRTALLADRADAGALAGQAEILIGDPALRVELGRAAREAALMRRWDKVLDGALAVYAEALAR